MNRGEFGMSAYRNAPFPSSDANGFVDIEGLRLGLDGRGKLLMSTSFPLTLLLAFAAWVIVLATAFSLGGMIG